MTLAFMGNCIRRPVLPLEFRDDVTRGLKCHLATGKRLGEIKCTLKLNSNNTNNNNNEPRLVT